MLYKFADCTLDTNGPELRRAGKPVDAEPQVVRLLSYLADNRQRTVGKDELIEAVWDGRIVSDATLNSRVSSARRAVGDDGKRQAVIRTFSKKGYRFVAELEGSTEPVGPAEKPSIAVLPFENLSGDPGEDYFAAGVTEDIITGLSAYRALRVIARNSSFAFSGQSMTALEIGLTLNVHYVVAGSVRKSGNRVRITASVAETSDGTELWSHRYDREFEDIFDVQDEVTDSIVAILPGRVQADGLARARRKNTENMAAYDCLLRGIDHYHRETAEDNARAIEFLQQALELDPGYAQAYAWLACVRGQGYYRGYITDVSHAELEQLGIDLLKRARELDDNDSEIFRILGAIHTNLAKHGEAEGYIERAVQLNPNDPRILSLRAQSHLWQGRPEEALPWLEAAKRRDPGMTETWWRWLGRIKFALGDYDSALECIARTEPAWALDQLYLTASLGHLGHAGEAKVATKALLAAVSRAELDVFLSKQPFSREEDRAQLAAGLAKAGLNN